MVKPTKFTIPANARQKYPICNEIYEELDTDSWFDWQGTQVNCNIGTTEKQILRCKQIKVIPDDHQRKILDEWFSIYRYVYNETVKYIKDVWLKAQKERNALIIEQNDPLQKKYKQFALPSFITLRPIIRKGINTEMQSWIDSCKIPVHTVDNAVKDAIKSYKTSSKLHKGTKYFRIRYKKQNANQTLVLEPNCFSKKTNSFSKHIGLIKTSESISGIEHDCRLNLKDGHFTLYVPYDKPLKVVEQTTECCSLDPGMRTFQTVYCSTGQTLKIGNNVIEKLKPLLNKLELANKSSEVTYFDDLVDHKRITMVDRKVKSKYKKRIRDRIRHIVEDLHWKTAIAVSQSAKKVLIGNMSTISILKGDCLTDEYKRLLQAMSHYTFRQRLKAKCEEYGTEFDVVDESYTSKTCGSCSEINADLGAKKVFKCPCGFEIDRDINGARNIMIKNS